MTPRTIVLDGIRVTVSSPGELDDEDRAALERLLFDPEALDSRCRQALLDPARIEGDEPTALYVRHHLEHRPDLMVGQTSPTRAGIDTFVRAMRVRSIWADGDSTIA